MAAFTTEKAGSKRVGTFQRYVCVGPLGPTPCRRVDFPRVRKVSSLRPIIEFTATYVLKMKEEARFVWMLKRLIKLI